MAMNPGLFTEWPWERLGSFKYLLYLPLLADAIRTNFLGGTDTENFSLHVLLLASLRYIQGQLWMSLTRFHGLVKKHRVQEKGMKFDQLDREKNWEDFILFQALLLYAYHKAFLFQIHPLWNWTGFIITVFWHAGPVEFLYYWFHRLLHHHYLFRRYHSHHHSSFLTQAVTGNVHPFAEHFGYAWLFGSTFIVNSFLGTSSIALLYAYTLWFDFMNYIGHCNWEFMPMWLFKTFPGLKYMIYTPSFHSLHHTQVHTNFCLFMPVYDYLYGTADKTSEELYVAARQGRTDTVDCVILTHFTDLLSIFHFSFGIPSFAARPYARKWYICLLYPLAFPIMLLLWAFGGPFTVDEHVIDKVSVQIWAIPRFNFHYNMASQTTGISKLVESAVLAAQARGARVICLSMHNKDEQLNGSRELYLKGNEELKIRVLDGSTLTSSIVAHKITKDTKEAFFIGAELKVGRAIAAYLCSRRPIIVKVLARSISEFEVLQRTVPLEFQHKLVRVDSLQGGTRCKTWLVGCPLTVLKQQYAPPGTSFYDFSEDCTEEAREDCSYSKLPAMHLPPGFKGVRACEGKMPRGVVLASHAAAIVAVLADWKHHEVNNAVDIDQIDSVMKSAIDHGFVPYY